MGKHRKEERMDEEMNTSELLKEVVEENQTRKILEILNDCKDLAEAKEKVKALLNKKDKREPERAVDLPKPPNLLNAIIHHLARERKSEFAGRKVGTYAKSKKRRV